MTIFENKNTLCAARREEKKAHQVVLPNRTDIFEKYHQSPRVIFRKTAKYSAVPSIAPKSDGFQLGVASNLGEIRPAVPEILQDEARKVRYSHTSTHFLPDGRSAQVTFSGLIGPIWMTSSNKHTVRFDVGVGQI